jgi:hypothetical protein
MSTDLFNDRSNAVDTADGIYDLDDSFDNGQQFSTGSTSFQISDVKLGLFDPTAASGTLTVALFSDAGGSPGSELNVLGTFDNASLPTSSSGLLDVSFSGITLAANTQYWVEVEDTASGVIQWNYDNVTGVGFPGTGVLHQFYQSGGGTSTDSNFPWVMEVAGEAACFASGTSIRTARGAVAVEALRVGDMAWNKAGATRPIRWIGHRTVDVARHPQPWDVMPIRVAAHAFGDGRPDRDLWLSPDHSVFVEGVLIPVRYLVNGATIRREMRSLVTYWHVELDRHDVILAEGLPCESYLDTGNRGAFANGGGAVLLHPDFALRIWETESCAPLVVGGAVLEAARSWVLERAGMLGHCMTGEPELRLAAGGREMQAEVLGRIHRFHVPEAARGVRLVSRSFVPGEMRDDSDDHRRLGVAVSWIAYGDEAIPLGDARLGAGWHAPEDGGADGVWRWTDGEAELAVAGGGIIDIEVAIAGRYWRDESGTMEGAEPVAA